MTTINLKSLKSGRIRHTGWSLGRDIAEQCGVNVDDYFGSDGEFLGPDENGLEPLFEEVETTVVYVVRDGAGEYLSDGGRTPASDEAREYETREEAEAACERATDRVLVRETE